jgi:putative ABC transport system permease protein
VSPLEALLQAFRLLRAHPTRSALTLFGLVWGTAAVIFLVGWGRGTEVMLEEAFQRTGKNLGQAWAGRVSEDFSPATDRRLLWFTREDVEAVRERSRLAEFVAGETRTHAPASFRQRAMSLEVRGMEPAGIAIRGAPLAAGRFLTQADVDHRRRVLVVGSRARERLLGPEGGLGSWVRLDGMPFQVVGLLGRVGTQLNRDGELMDDQLWVPLSTHLGQWPNPFVDEDVVRTILFRVYDRSRIPEAKLEIRRVLADRLRVPRGDEEAISIWSPVEMLDRLPVGEETTLFNGLIAIATLVIGGIGVLSMMLDTVRERRPEIGIRLAVGATRRDILVQFFLESFAIVLFGGLLGVALGIGGCLLLGSDALRGNLPADARDLIPAPVLSLDVVVLALTVMATVGVVAGVVPAWRASQVDPAETLRAEG